MSAETSSVANLPKADPLRMAVGELFSAFQRLFPNRWDRQFADEHARPTWYAGLRAAGVTGPMVKRGLVALAQQRLAWPPSCGEFAELCLPSAPSDAAAFSEALVWARDAQHEFSHAAVGAAAKSVGTWNLRALDERAVRAAFGTAYRTALGRLARGESLDVPIPRALPAEVHRGIPPGQPDPPIVAAERAKLARLLGVSS